MPVQLPQDMMSEVTEQMNYVSSRINAIKQKSDEIDKEVTQRDDEWKKNMENFSYKIELLSQQLKDMKKEFAYSLNNLRKIIDEFRGVAKESSIDELKEKIDNLQFENLIIKEQFERMLQG